MKNKLDDDSNAMIMIKKIWKFSVFYVNFPNKIMDQDCCIFYDEPKSEELREIAKASSKEKADKEKKKTEET